MSKSPLTPAERAWVDAAMARIKAVIGNPRPPSSEDENMRRKMQDTGGPIVIEPESKALSHS